MRGAEVETSNAQQETKKGDATRTLRAAESAEEHYLDNSKGIMQGQKQNLNKNVPASLQPGPPTYQLQDQGYQPPLAYHEPFQGGYGSSPGLQRDESVTRNSVYQDQNETDSLGPWDSASQRPPASHVGSHTTLPLNYEEGRGHLRHKGSTAGLSYIDEEGGYYRSPHPRPASALMSGSKDQEMEMGLVNGAAGMAGHNDGDKPFEYGNSPYPYPPSLPSQRSNATHNPNVIQKALGAVGLSDNGKYPVEQQIERRRSNVFRQRWPFVSWILAVVMCGVMIFELIKNNSITGSPIATKPTFNYMIGPTPSVLINIGARFIPCMKLVEALPPTFQLACLSDTGNPPTTSCSIEEICGFGGFDGKEPNQGFRFILPIFLHVGIIHLLLNMAAQVWAAAQVEREMGSIAFAIVYFAGGIYGNILGGNFSRTGIPSVGASGALFATNACVLVDLLLHWKYEDRPKLKAFFLAIEFAIGIAIGYIPNAVDGLAHLGGFAMGILFGIILYPAICPTRQRKIIVWVLRVIAVVLIVLAFVLTTKNFYTDDPNAACTWCRFLSCIPTNANERCKGTGITTTTTNPSRRWEL